MLDIRTPRLGRQARFHTRPDTNDGALITGLLGEDEYDLASLPGELSGIAIDVGAHVGAITVALALDHPDLQVIAVEPVPSSVEILRKNIITNGLEDRVTVYEAAAAAPGTKTLPVTWNYRSAGEMPHSYLHQSRFVGNLLNPPSPGPSFVEPDADTFEVEAVSLDELAEDWERIRLVKIDCEGCEWAFLTSPRVADVELILGEWHDGPKLAGLEYLLRDSHDVSQIDGHDDIGVFWAVAR